MVEKELQLWAMGDGVRHRKSPVLTTTLEAFVAAYPTVFSVTDGVVRLMH